MPYTVTEQDDSRSYSVGSSPRADLLYVVQGTESTDAEAEAIAALLSASPATYQGLPRISRGVRPLIPKTLYEGTVTYGAGSQNDEPPPPTQGAPVWKWKTGTTSTRLSHGITEFRYPLSAPTMYAAINVTDQGVEGVDVDAKEHSWPEQHVVPASSFGFANAVAIGNLVKSVNNAGFRGFAAGEVLFDEFEADPRNEDEIVLTFVFRARKNVTGQSIGGITGIDKTGWQYLWVRSQKATDAGSLVEEPAGVYVNEVYEAVDFGLLGIGTGVL